MRQDSFRFEPPPIELSPELRWVLVRSFAPVAAPVPSVGRLDEARALAHRLGTAGRIGGRHAAEVLVAETGRQAGVAFMGAQAATAEREEGVIALAALVAETAATAGIPLAFVKFVGMHHAGIRGRGWRGTSDVDVLPPPAEARRLLKALVDAGLRPSGFPGYDHCVPGALGPRGSVDIHLYVPDVRPSGQSAFMDFETAQDGGWLNKVEDLPGQAYAPVRSLLLAHTIGHGLNHHGMNPASYPLLRMVGDILDIDPSEDEVRAARTLLEQDVSHRELAAALALARQLAAGTLDFEATGDDDALLLRHVLAGVLDADYQRSLKIKPLQGTPLAVARKAWRAVALTDAQLDAVYGRHQSRLGYTLRRLARPFDLVGRTVAAARASWRVSRRG